MTNFNYDASHFTNANNEQRQARKKILNSASDRLKFKDDFFRSPPS